MLELLILYVLNKRDNTLYGLKKEITAYYGEVSIPSHGALFPILKKLEKKEFLKVRKKLSSGGRRYTYYEINKNPSEYFSQNFLKFNTAKTETLENYLTWLKIHLITIDMLDKNLVDDFRDKCLLKLNFYKEQIINKQNNTYIELSRIQNELLQFYLTEIDEFEKILKSY